MRVYWILNDSSQGRADQIQAVATTKASVFSDTRKGRLFLSCMQGWGTKMEPRFIPEISIFHCINTFQNAAALPLVEHESCRIRTYKLPCSSMVKDVYLLRAFEAGADAVLVFVCPEGQCRYVEGNLRAAKRVGFVKNLLDEIRIDARRLALFNVPAGDAAAAAAIIHEILPEIIKLGPNPAR